MKWALQSFHCLLSICLCHVFLGGRFGYFLYFSARGGVRGSSRRQECGGGVRCFSENPRRGGGFQEGEGPRGREGGTGDFFGGGGG